MPFSPQRVRQDTEQLSGVLSPGFEVHSGRAGFETEENEEYFSFRAADAGYSLTDELLGRDGTLGYARVGIVLGRTDQLNEQRAVADQPRCSGAIPERPTQFSMERL